MDLNLKGKRALVTGGSKGIGRACAQVLAEEGCIVTIASRDAQTLEAAAALAKAAGRPVITPDDVAAAEGQRMPRHDRAGDAHFALLSALHKSLRDSDPDAGVYWLARMLEAGEDPLYVARRLVRFATEDVGLADPQALPTCIAAWQAYERMGSPEGELALAQALDAGGLPVFARARGYTRSHQLAVEAARFGGGQSAARRLRR